MEQSYGEYLKKCSNGSKVNGFKIFDISDNSLLKKADILNGSTIIKINNKILSENPSIDIFFKDYSQLDTIIFEIEYKKTRKVINFSKK